MRERITEQRLFKFRHAVVITQFVLVNLFIGTEKLEEPVDRWFYFQVQEPTVKEWKLFKKPCTVFIKSLESYYIMRLTKYF